MFANAQIIATNEVTKPTDIESAIIYYANVYNVKASDLFRVGFCESGLVQEKDGYPVLGKAGEIGIMQFKSTTFYWFAKQMGLKNPSILSWEDQIKVAAWAFSVGKQSHWTCK